MSTHSLTSKLIARIRLVHAQNPQLSVPKLAERFELGAGTIRRILRGEARPRAFSKTKRKEYQNEIPNESCDSASGLR